jgi:SpoVK/Ycf46/Vps4 family AAA+-type ATPase
VDLPEEEARRKILDTQLKGEKLSEAVNLAEIARRTKMYSGSDLKNVCVTAATARAKEDIVKRSQGDAFQDNNSLEQIEDWSTFLQSQKNSVDISQIGPLEPKHFEIGLSECPPSLADETESLAELRKWDRLYGDGSSRKKKTNGIGFQVPNADLRV